MENVESVGKSMTDAVEMPTEMSANVSFVQETGTFDSNKQVHTGTSSLTDNESRFTEDDLTEQ